MPTTKRTSSEHRRRLAAVAVAATALGVATAPAIDPVLARIAVNHNESPAVDAG